MKKFIFTAVMVFLLAACGSNNEIQGVWKMGKYDGGCAYNEFEFMDGENFSAISRNGNNESGTYEKIGDNKYKLDFGIESVTYEIKRSGDTLEMKKQGRDNVCVFNKE